MNVCNLPLEKLAGLPASCYNLESGMWFLARGYYQSYPILKKVLKKCGLRAICSTKTVC